MMVEFYFGVLACVVVVVLLSAVAVCIFHLFDRLKGWIDAMVGMSR